MLGPPRFTPPVCFLSPQQHRSYMPFSAQPAGNWGVRYNKKGDWGVLSSGLWFINLLSFKFQTNGVGLWYTLWGVIVKHRTIRIHQSPVFSNCWRIDKILAQCSQGTQGTKAPKAKVQEVEVEDKKNLQSLLGEYILVAKQQAGQLLNTTKEPLVLKGLSKVEP